MSGSSASQRVNRPRTTTESSTTITRIALRGAGEETGWGCGMELDTTDRNARRHISPGDAGRSDQPDFLELGLDDFLVERFHDVFVRSRVHGAGDVREIV